MIAASFSLAVGRSAALNVAGTLSCTSGDGDVTVKLSSGGTFTLTPGSGTGPSVAGSPGGSSPVYDTPDPVTSVRMPPSLGMPRTPANLALAKARPDVNIALQPVQQVADVPTGYVTVAPVVVTVTVTAGTGCYWFRVTQ